MKTEYCDWKHDSSVGEFARLFRPRAGRTDFVRRQGRWVDSNRSPHQRFDVPYKRERAALDRIIEESRCIVDIVSEENLEAYALSTWKRATDYLRRLVLHGDIRGHDLPLPRIVPAQDGSIDLLWKSGSRGLLINFPEGAEQATYYGKKPNLQTSGVLFTDDAHDELIRWLVL